MKKIMVIVMAMVMAVMSIIPMTTQAFSAEETSTIYTVLEEGRDEGTLKVSSNDMRKLEKILSMDEDNDVVMLTSVSNSAYGPYRMYAVVMIGYVINNNYVYRAFTMAALNDEGSRAVITDVNTKWRIASIENLDRYNFDWNY